MKEMAGAPSISRLLLGCSSDVSHHRASDPAVSANYCLPLASLMPQLDGNSCLGTIKLMTIRSQYKQHPSQ